MDYFTYLMPVQAMNDIYREVQGILFDREEMDIEKLKAAFKAVCLILYTDWEEGLLSLEEKLNTGEIKETGAPHYAFLAEIVIYCVDAHDSALILDMMVNDYYVNGYDAADKVALFLYMVCVMECTARGKDFEMMNSAQTYVRRNLSMFPKEYHAELVTAGPGRFREGFADGRDWALPFDWEGLLEMHVKKDENKEDCSDGKDLDDWDPVMKISGRDIAQAWPRKKEVLCSTGKVVDAYFFQMCNALWRVEELCEGAFHQGLAFVEEMGRELQKTGSDTDAFFGEAICLWSDGELGVRYRMLERYDELERESGKDWLRFLYLEAVYVAFMGIHPRLIREICLTMLPSEKRNQCRRILEKRRKGSEGKSGIGRV